MAKRFALILFFKMRLRRKGEALPKYKTRWTKKMNYETWIDNIGTFNSKYIDYEDDCYVLFAMTGKEQQALQSVNAILGVETIRPFLPTIEVPFKRHGKVRNEIKPMFPGYLFVISEIPYDEFVVKIYECIRYSKYILKLLNYGDWRQASMNFKERQMLELLWKDINKDKVCIKCSKVIIEGDAIVVTEGPLKGRESIIKRINRHKMQAAIEVEIFGEIREITVGLEIVAKI